MTDGDRVLYWPVRPDLAALKKKISLESNEFAEEWLPPVRPDLAALKKKISFESNEPAEEWLPPVRPDLAALKKKMSLESNEPAEEWVPWDAADFMKEKSYWTDVCKLPSTGTAPGAVSEAVVTDKDLSECFGNFGKNGASLKECRTIPHKDIIHLTRILDGHDTPLNCMIGKNLAKGLYVHFIRREPVDWASFAALKHKNQIQKALRDKKPRPEGPPLVRVDRVYNPRVDVLYEVPMAAPSSEQLPVESIESKPTCRFQAGSDFRSPSDVLPARTFELGEKYQPDCSPFTCSLLDFLKVEVSNLTETQCTHNERLVQTKEVLKKLDDSGRDLEKCLELNVHCLTLTELRVNKEQERLAKLLEEKQSSAVELEDTIMETDEEDANAQKAIEELERIDNSLAVDLIECQAQVEKAQNAWEDEKTKVAEKRDGISRATAVRAKTTELVKDLENKACEIVVKLLSCEQEIALLSKHFQIVCTSLKPRFIVTAPKLQQHLFKMTPCAVCFLGYHCNNFIPTSCGHTYHPACLMPLVSVELTESPRCVACGDIFHPDWLASWGLSHSSPELVSMEVALGLNEQRAGFEKQLIDLYKEGASQLEARRDKERSKLLLATRRYSKDDGRIDSYAGEVKRKAELIELSYGSTGVTTNVGVREQSRKDVSLDLTPKPEKRRIGSMSDATSLEDVTPTPGKKGAGRKRKSAVASSEEIGKKVLTRANALTSAERAATDSSPLQNETIGMKLIGDVATPATSGSVARQGPGRSSKPDLKKKLRMEK